MHIHILNSLARISKCQCLHRFKSAPVKLLVGDDALQLTHEEHMERARRVEAGA